MIFLTVLALTATVLQPPRGAPRAARPDTIDRRPVVIRGATIVDFSNFGGSAADVPDAVVVVDRGRIVAAGPRARVRVPAHARIIDARGRYVVPGYVDGFAALANQAFANAFLAM